MNVRDLSTVERAAAWLEELISACRTRGPLYCHDVALTNDEVRKAKALRTSLSMLRASLDDPEHQPRKEEPVARDPIYVRLNFEAPLSELARIIRDGEVHEDELRELMKPVVEKHGEATMRMAMFDLTWTHQQTRMVELHPHVRKHCKMLLGPPPEERDAFYANVTNPPPNPYTEAAEPDKKKRVRKKKG